MMTGSPLLAVVNSIAAVVALNFHVGARRDQEVKDNDPNRQGEHIIVVPINDAVIVILTIAAGIGGGRGGTMRLLVLKEESQE